MTQLGFAYDPPVIRRRKALGERAAERAQRAVSRVWLEEACQAIALYGYQHPDGWLFEDARAWAEREGVVRAAPDPRAWGAVCGRLQAKQRIRAVGVERSKSNACLKPTWAVVR